MQEFKPDLVFDSEIPGWMLDGVYYGEEYDQALLTGILGLCGCGRPTEVEEKLIDILTKIKNRSEKWSYIDWTIEEEIILHLLHSKKLLDHGSSIGRSWLTSKGEWFLKELKTFAAGERNN